LFSEFDVFYIVSQGVTEKDWGDREGNDVAMVATAIVGSSWLRPNLLRALFGALFCWLR